MITKTTIRYSRNWKRHSTSFFKKNQKTKAAKQLRRSQKKAKTFSVNSSTKESREQKISRMFPGYKLLNAPEYMSLLNNEQETLDFLKKLQNNYNAANKVAVLLDNVQAITTDAIAVLLSNMVHFKAAKIGFNGTRPRNQQVRYILEASGFFEHLYGQAMRDQETYSFRKINNYIYTHGQKTVEASIADDIVKYASETVWGEARRCPGIQTTLVELMHNTYDHAGEQKGEKHWWISVEHNEQEHEVTFSFIDFGVGIFRSLENKKTGEPLFGAMDYIMRLFPWAKTEAEKLQLILEGKVRLTQSNEYYRGKGLRNIYQRSQKMHIADLAIISNYAAAKVFDNDYHALRNEFLGTFISFKMNKNTYNLQWQI